MCFSYLLKFFNKTNYYDQKIFWIIDIDLNEDQLDGLQKYNEDIDLQTQD